MNTGTLGGDRVQSREEIRNPVAGRLSPQGLRLNRSLSMSDSSISIPLEQGYSVIIDSADTDLTKHEWQLIQDEHRLYVVRSFRDDEKLRYIGLHREIMSIVLGRALETHEYVDHINGDGLDNRRENLRLATNSQNQMNKRVPKNNRSGYKGVLYLRRKRKWQASITINRKQIQLGRFASKDDAIAARQAAEIKYFGEFRRVQ